MSYIQKSIGKIRELPQQSCALLWMFPEEDFPAYKAMPDTPTMNTYNDYLALLAAIQADVERTGKVVRRMQIPVAMMLAELEKHGWPNDVKHRTKVIGLLGYR
jgi:hypothetical protein